MVKTTLQARVIVLMVAVSAFLIAAFTAIQLNNQVQKTTAFNLYKAKLGALITREKLREVFSSSDPGRFPKAKINEIFSSLAQSNIIETAALLDESGMPVISCGDRGAGSSVYDAAVLKNICRKSDGSKWLFPFVDKKRRAINLFIAVKNPYGYAARLTFSLGNLKEALYEVYKPVGFMTVIVIIGNIILATMLSRIVISPIKLLNEATKGTAKGDLDRKLSINTQDELEELAGTFNYMTSELKKMKAKAESANPLTKLPGNIVIQERVEERLAENKKFVLLYCDLDNFKAFNDKYGVHSGDKAIVLTAGIFKEAISKEGAADDFIGHEGGDDFLLLTIPEKAERVGGYIIEEFDKRIRDLYSKEDLKKGYIEAKARDRDEVVKFPIMSISLAGVTNAHRKIDSYAQITNIAAEVKKAAKKSQGSKMVIDKRTDDLGRDERRGGKR